MGLIVCRKINILVLRTYLLLKGGVQQPELTIAEKVATEANDPLTKKLIKPNCSLF